MEGHDSNSQILTKFHNKNGETVFSLGTDGRTCVKGFKLQQSRIGSYLRNSRTVEKVVYRSCVFSFPGGFSISS